MYDDLIAALRNSGADTDGAIRRFVGNSQMYGQFLVSFTADGSFADITSALEQDDLDAALTAAHTLKGISGNLGLTKLYEASSSMVSLIRAGDRGKAVGSFADVKTAYDEVCGIIGRYA